ncbi:MAG: hypothetical protein K8R41_05735 [Bacteroidales bacterium]|nr:hypothetical protein [Bacteroidales bacterium]
MTTLLQIIFIFLLIYYFFRLFGRYIFPWLLKRFMKNIQNKYQQNTENTSAKKKKNGEVNIDHIPKDKKKREDDDFGEYIDFEEIDK